MEKELKVKPVDNAKLWELSKVIIDALKNAKKIPEDKVLDWDELEGEWFDWLREELIDEKV